MSNIFTQFFKKDSADSEEHKKNILSDLMRREATLNKNLFGAVASDNRREFFCLDKNTWVWYEEWTDKSGQRQKMTTRYLVREKEIVKSVNGTGYKRLTIDEATNFQKATRNYVQNASSSLYANHQHSSGV